MAVPRRNRWPFYLSLFLNVVLLTAIVLGAWRVMQWRDVPMGMGPWMPRQVERALPEGAREKVKAIREAHAGEFKPLFDGVRQAREGIRNALDAEPFSADALRTALAGMRRADEAVAEATADVIVEIASALTPEERKQVREAFREKMKDRRKDRRGPDDELMPPPPPGDELPPPAGP
jgi:uncharacterized membrane protein